MMTFWKWFTLAGMLGAGVGGLLVLISIAGGGHTYAGMLLVAGIASFPAGVWIFDVSAEAMARGAPGMLYPAMVAAPAVNAASLCAVGWIIVKLVEAMAKKFRQ